MKLNRVYISIGSNTAPEDNLPAGVELLRTWMNVIAISPVYESLPIGGSPNDARFLNAALYVETYTYLDLLRKRLRSLEHQLGRIRTDSSEGQAVSVTLDLDILLFNNEIDRSVLAPLPHPDLLQHAHVIIPVADLAPDFQHPVTGATLAALAAPFRDTAGLKQRDDVKLA